MPTLPIEGCSECAWFEDCTPQQQMQSMIQGVCMMQVNVDYRWNTEDQVSMHSCVTVKKEYREDQD